LSPETIAAEYGQASWHQQHSIQINDTSQCVLRGFALALEMPSVMTVQQRLCTSYTNSLSRSRAG